MTDMMIILLTKNRNQEVEKKFKLAKYNRLDAKNDIWLTEISLNWIFLLSFLTVIVIITLEITIGDY